MKNSKLLMTLLAITLCGCTSTSWQTKLKQDVPVFGHRNWIVVADSAYPKQSAAGIETVYTDGSQLEVLRTVLEELAASRHIKPIILVDAELQKVAESDAPGVNNYRAQLYKILEGQQFKEMPHEDIIHKLDQASEMFNILILKTDLTIPYTSVFLELDCAYWNAEKERKLRSMPEK
jgi:hypothetical protein